MTSGAAEMFLEWLISVITPSNPGGCHAATSPHAGHLSTVQVSDSPRRRRCSGSVTLMGAGRDLDIVLYGATGSVGTLTARYLAQAGTGARIGLAGRSSQRLHALRRSLGDRATDWPLLVADLARRH